MDKQPFLKGVNLGGWLVVERWLTPSLFEGTDAVDEYTLLSSPGGQKKLRQHHRNFIASSDLRWLKENGINALRIPVGYWIFGGEDPYVGAIDCLDWVIKEAKKNDLLVLIDLHGAPGSQNGEQHSGRQGKAIWYKNKKTRLKTIDILVRLAKRYRNEEQVFALEMLNEPKIGLFNFILRRFYNEAYTEIVKVARPGLNIVFSDAFTPKLLSGVIKHPNPAFPVIMDSHWYHFLLGILSKILSANIYFIILKRRQKLYQKLSKKQKVIIGEWSIVMSANTGNFLTGRKNYTEPALMVEHGQLQMDIYEKSTAGWFYWSYKTESHKVMDFRRLVESKEIII